MQRRIEQAAAALAIGALLAHTGGLLLGTPPVHDLRINLIAVWGLVLYLGWRE